MRGDGSRDGYFEGGGLGDRKPDSIHRRETAATISRLSRPGTDLARRTVLMPGVDLGRKRTEKLLLKRDYREVTVPE